MPRKSKAKEKKSTASSKPVQSPKKKILPSSSKPIKTWTEIIQEEIDQSKADLAQQQLQIQEWFA